MTTTFIIGDVHGCLVELDDLLKRLAPTRGDRLLFVGDLVDRGPDTLGVLRRVRELFGRYPGSLSIAGNHEYKALRRRARGELGEPWTAEANDADWQFLDSLRLFHRLPELDVVMVHGGFFPAYFARHETLGEPSPGWRTDRGAQADRMRRFLKVRTIDERGEMVALDRTTSEHRHWSETYDGRAGFCFYGHDPQLDPPVPRIAEHAIGLDTACCFGGRLTAAIIAPSTDPRRPRFESVPARQRYAEPMRRVGDAKKAHG